MKIRNIEQTDVLAILALIKAKAKFDGCLALLVSQDSDIYDAFFSESPKAKAIVAELDNEVIGIATYYDIYSTFIAKPGIWLDDLFVYEQHRETGIGKALVKELCKRAKTDGYGRIDWIVGTENENGRGFYESLGANIFEEVRHTRLDENAIAKLATSP